MSVVLLSTFSELIRRLSALPNVQSIGRSGGRPLPAKPSDGDIDVFLYCDSIPPTEARRVALHEMGTKFTDIKMDAIGGGRWGVGDLVYIGGFETWLMYFTLEQATAEVDAVLAGQQPGREGSYFYPTGRCAMYLKMEILCDKTGFLAGMKEYLSVYPENLAHSISKVHMDALGDTEDLERAVTRRDVLFYHFALDLALDHFLQALFAMNRVFFPSRKRSMEHIHEFKVKPERCEERLLEVLRLGGSPEGIGQSYQMWKELVLELINT